MDAFRFTVAVVATIALCLALTLRLHAADTTAMPALPQLGTATTGSPPDLGDLSGAGKAVGGTAPGRLGKTLRNAKAAAPPPLRGQNEQRIYAKYARSVVLVVTKDSLGSGTVIGTDGTILTNWHVVDGFKTVGVIFKPQTEGARVFESDAVQAKVVRVDEVADLAIIKVAAIPKNVGVIGLANPAGLKVGADVHAIGHPMGEIWSYTKGIVSQIRPGYEWLGETKGIRHRADVVQTQTPISPGNSGGPLLDDAGGLVGIASFGGHGQQLNFAIGGTEIERFLAAKGDRLAAQKKTAAPTASAAPGNAQPCAEPALLKTARTKTNDATAFVMDVNCNGRADAVIFVYDDKSVIAMALDADENGKVEAIYIDTDADSKFDVVYFDVDEDGKQDLVGYDLDDNLEPRRIELARS